MVSLGVGVESISLLDVLRFISVPGGELEVLPVRGLCNGALPPGQPGEPGEFQVATTWRY